MFFFVEPTLMKSIEIPYPLSQKEATPVKHIRAELKHVHVDYMVIWNRMEYTADTTEPHLSQQ